MFLEKNNKISKPPVFNFIDLPQTIHLRSFFDHFNETGMKMTDSGLLFLNKLLNPLPPFYKLAKLDSTFKVITTTTYCHYDHSIGDFILRLMSGSKHYFQFLTHYRFTKTRRLITDYSRIKANNLHFYSAKSFFSSFMHLSRDYNTFYFKHKYGGNILIPYLLMGRDFNKLSLYYLFLKNLSLFQDILGTKNPYSFVKRIRKGYSARIFGFLYFVRDTALLEHYPHSPYKVSHNKAGPRGSGTPLTTISYLRPKISTHKQLIIDGYVSDFLQNARTKPIRNLFFPFYFFKKYFTKIKKFSIIPSILKVRNSKEFLGDNPHNLLISEKVDSVIIEKEKLRLRSINFLDKGIFKKKGFVKKTSTVVSIFSGRKKNNFLFKPLVLSHSIPVDVTNYNMHYFQNSSPFSEVIFPYLLTFNLRALLKVLSTTPFSLTHTDFRKTFRKRRKNKRYFYRRV